MRGRSGHNRRSIRLPGFDYTQPGGYFITICTFDRVPRFGTIQNDEVRLSVEGEIVVQIVEALPTRFPNVTVENFIVMPNHIHLLLMIHDQNEPKKEKPPTLGQVVGYLKYNSTQQVNLSMGASGQKIWQRNYYEHIIRNEIDYLSVGQYIQNNPVNWETDEEKIIHLPWFGLPAPAEISRHNPRGGGLPAP